MTLARPIAASVSVAPTTAPSIEALDRMTINEKLAHFARRDAFKLPKRDGDRVARTRRLSKSGLPRKLTPGSIQLDDGHVTRQAYQVIGRPCFGIPTAKLVHGREYKVQPDGNLVFARCGECPVKSACNFICDERLHANDTIWEAFREFERHGGRDAFWSADRGSRAVGSALRELLRHLQSANFTSVADAGVAAHYDDKALQKREADAERQRQHRAQVPQMSANTSSMPSDHSIKGAARLLRDNLSALQKAAKCPRKLRQIDLDLMERIWVARMKLSRLGRPHGATHIASAIAIAYPNNSHDSLRKRIETVLKRLPLLEALLESPSNGSVDS